MKEILCKQRKKVYICLVVTLCISIFMGFVVEAVDIDSRTVEIENSEIVELPQREDESEANADELEESKDVIDDITDEKEVLGESDEAEEGEFEANTDELEESEDVIDDIADEEDLLGKSEESESFALNTGGEDAPTNLRINLLSLPYGITKEAMSFSWANSLKNDMQSQEAYRIVIALRREELNRKNYVYDSNWIVSNQNTSVLLDLSSVLEDNELYYWQVQVRNELGRESNMSEPQAFSTSVGGQWASRQGIWGTTGQKIVFLRQSIQKPVNVEKAIISITATSTMESRQYVYNLYVNGKELGVGPSRQNGSILYYNTYDITDELVEGNNIVGVICYSENFAAFLCQITYYMSDGSQIIAGNSGRDMESWSILDGDSIYLGSNSQSIGTSYYKARQDNVDAGIFPFEWNIVDYPANGWIRPVKSNVIENYTLQPAQIENMKRYEVFPKSVTHKADNSYLIDFGQEIVGTIALNVNSGSNTSIILEYGEELDVSGNAKYRLNTGNVYQETWRLKPGRQQISGIGMKTFRYVTIRNLPFAIGKEHVQGLTIRQIFEDEASSFTSSNSVLNDLYNLAKYTCKITNQDVYVDTQSRERKPYEGDALITAMNSYGFSAASTSALYSSNYLLDNTTWPAEYSLYNIMLVYENYMYTGDTRNLETAYQKLKNKTLERYYNASVGLVGDVRNPTVQGQKIMVDWPESEIDGYKKQESYYNTVFNAVCVGGYESMAEIANVLGYSGDATYYQNLAESIRNNMITKLYNADKGEFYDGLTQDGTVVSHSSQHATAYALAFGIYKDQKMSDNLAIAIEKDEEVKMSVYGTYFLLQGLYRSNHGDLARKIMSNPEKIKGVRSWAYMLYGLGATATTEAWNSVTKPNMSLCHPWGTAPGAMLIQGMIGVRPTSAGFDTFQIKLQPGGVKEAAATVPTLKGEIAVSYKMDGSGGILCDILVPANAEGTLYIPNKNATENMIVDGDNVNGKKLEGYLVYKLESGSHSIFANTGIFPDTSELKKTDIVYTSYIKGDWQQEVTNGIDIGNTGLERMEAIRLSIRNQQIDGSVQYAAYMQSRGWLEWVENDNISGLPGEGKRLEAVKIRLTGELKKQYNVFYRAYVAEYGWLDWAENGEPAGTSGKSKAICILQIKLVKKEDGAPGSVIKPYVSAEKRLAYTTHVQTYGWQEERGDGEVAGTEGEKKRLEAIRIKLNDKTLKGGITYSTHVQSYGWQKWKTDGEMAGTSRESKRLEAIKIKLTGSISKEYDVYYRVHVQSFGWLGWAKNGEPSGSEGYAKRLEAIQIRLVKKENIAPETEKTAFCKARVSYRTHVQNYGWMSYVYDGQYSGTEGQSKRLEAIQIKNLDKDISGSIKYRTHIQTYGWESSWKSNGQMSGTSGESKRLEAIQIRLEGELAKKYDVYYRVHIQSYGWLDWAKNGSPAGSEGLSKRLESIEICYVEKGGEAPGSIKNAFVKK